MSTEADWNDFEFSKAPNPWEHTCSCKPQTVQVPHFKRLLSFPPSPLFARSFSLPPPRMAATLPLSTEPGAYWNTFPWSSLNFKVDFHPRARSEGGGLTGKGPSPWIVRTSKPATFSYELFENWRTFLKKQVTDAIVGPLPGWYCDYNCLTKTWSILQQKRANFMVLQYDKYDSL